MPRRAIDNDLRVNNEREPMMRTGYVDRGVTPWPRTDSSRSTRFSRTRSRSSLKKDGDTEVGSVVFPASASGGRMTEDRISPNLPIVESFRSAVRLANEMKVALVVMDPEGVWKAEWGDLYRPV